MCVLLDANPTHGSAPIQQEARATSSLTAHLHQRAWRESRKGNQRLALFLLFWRSGLKTWAWQDTHDFTPSFAHSKTWETFKKKSCQRLFGLVFQHFSGIAHEVWRWRQALYSLPFTFRHAMPSLQSPSHTKDWPEPPQTTKMDVHGMPQNLW